MKPTVRFGKSNKLVITDGETGKAPVRLTGSGVRESEIVADYSRGRLRTSSMVERR